MTQLNLKNYDWVSMSAERRIGDTAWQYTIQFHGSPTDESVDLTTFTDLLYRPDITAPPIMLTHLTTIRRDIGTAPQKRFTASGYSMGWYLRDTVPWNLRTSKLYTSGTHGGVVATEEAPVYENPTTYLKRLLFDDGNITKPLRGLYPASTVLTTFDNYFVPVPGWGTSIPCKQFSFDSESIAGAIDAIAEYCHMILLEDYRLISGVWRTVVFWVPEIWVDKAKYQGDDKIGIPPAITITSKKYTDSADYLVQMVGNPARSGEANSEESKNCVTVELLRSKDDSETWFRASSTLAAGTPRRELLYQSADVLKSTDLDGTVNDPITATTCYGKLNKKLVELKAFIAMPDTTYEVTFRNRYDFRLYQTMTFVNFSDLAATGELRIVGIRYDCNPTSQNGNTVTLTLTPTRAWILSRKYGRLMDDMQNQVSQIEKIVFAQIRSIQSGTITFVAEDGSYALATSDVTGLTIKGRSWNQ